MRTEFLAGLAPETVLVVLAALGWASYAAATAVTARKGLSAAIGAAALCLHASWALVRTIASGHAPFSNLYESLLFFSLLICIKSMISFGRAGRPVRLALTGAGLAAILASLCLPEPMRSPAALGPALRSPWILVHVPAAFYGYVSLAGALAAAILERAGKKPPIGLARGEAAQAFFFLGLGIVAGAFWADLSWGVFWSWDAKETWALVTWILVAWSLHLKSPRGRLLALCLASAAMAFTYVGVSFILPGLHSYI
jgi:ABC-type transport system involved in cytochrome c biogenesis permease subunit